MKLLGFCMVIFIFSSLAHSQGKCKQEKQQVDHWNSQLKYKVTEHARNKHRAAKADYLVCLRQVEPVQSKKSNAKVTDSTNITNLPDFKTKTKSTAMKSVTVSRYVNFKGKKKAAWQQYFIEPTKCLENRSDMSVFVKCAKLRKHELKRFNARWDANTQTLKPLLEP
ncbi:MAG: hypothetical protein ABJH28_02880 [Paraglaciecola sp.]|uniref:hypothetical protein n=1 Tax=Paraglaciecola sp. TaxID=1920173 RepID=UPI003264AD28